MSKVEYAFLDYVRLTNQFLNGDQIIREAIDKTAEKSTRSIVDALLTVQEAIKNLERQMKLKEPRGDDFKTEFQFNPFNAVMVEIDHSLIGGERIKGRKMTQNEVEKYYSGNIRH